MQIGDSVLVTDDDSPWCGHAGDIVMLWPDGRLTVCFDYIAIEFRYSMFDLGQLALIE